MGWLRLPFSFLAQSLRALTTRLCMQKMQIEAMKIRAEKNEDIVKKAFFKKKTTCNSNYHSTVFDGVWHCQDPWPNVAFEEVDDSPEVGYVAGTRCPPFPPFFRCLHHILCIKLRYCYDKGPISYHARVLSLVTLVSNQACELWNTWGCHGWC